MDWNTKWEWKNHDIFTSKVVTASPEKLQLTNWEEDMNESFNLSASDVANYSSPKSSMSASTESSFKEGRKMSKFGYIGGEVNGESSLLEASVSSGEPSIGLKLGKRTYFENNFGRSDSKVSSDSDIPVLPVVSSAGKKAKSSCQSGPFPRCQVEGCDLDLSSAKEYHRKHRVCETHSKCPKVVVSGHERRFCQQCSRFHSLAEFDEKKRSCRRRLSDHNARRRKPQQETVQFNPTNLSSFYGGGQQLSFQSRPAMSSTWESSSNSTYSIAKMRTNKPGILDGKSHLPNFVNMPTIAFNRPVPSMGTSVEVLDQGFKESLAPNVEALRALSLLSSNSWGVYEPDFIRLDIPQPMSSDNLYMVQPGLQTVPQGLPPDYWQTEQQSIDPHIPAKTSNAPNSQFQQFQLFNRFYSNPMDEILKPL